MIQPTLLTLALVAQLQAQPVTETLTPPVLDANVLRSLFSKQFAVLDAQPESIVADRDEQERLVGDLLGCPSREESGGDDFTVADCNKRSAELRGSKEPIYLELHILADDKQYDFKRGRWTITFTDDLSGDGLSVWRPSMPARIQGKSCEDGTLTCYPLELPRTYKKLSLFVPMTEADARAWRDTWTSSGAERGQVRLNLLVSIQQGTQWSKKWTRWFNPEEAHRTREYRGMLVRVHAMSLRLGEHVWSFPDWWPPPR